MTYPKQSDQRTCGIATLAAFIARNDASNGANFVRYCTATPTEVARMQADLHRIAARVGLPWPRTLGTSPWALATLAGKATGRPYRVVLWNDAGVQAVRDAWQSGEDVMLYTGDRALPRHVVLLLGRGSAQAATTASGQATIFEPGAGTLIHISPEELATAEWSGRAGKTHWGWWTRPLMAVIPDLND